MATFNYPASVAFGAARSGLAANVLYAVIDSGGTTRIGPSGTGVAEADDGAGNPTTGLYAATLAIDYAWLPCRVRWTISDAPDVAAEETIGEPVAAVVAVNDKTGYSLSQGFPANFAATAIDTSGRVQVQYGTATGQIDLSAGAFAGMPAAIPGAVDDSSPTTAGFKTTGLKTDGPYPTGAIFWVNFTSGTLAGVTVAASSYTFGAAGTQALAFATALPTAPANADTFDLFVLPAAS